MSLACINIIFALVKKKKTQVVLPAIAITDYAAEGKALARHEGKVIFVSGAVPGDVADLRLTKSKKDWACLLYTSRCV